MKKRYFDFIDRSYTAYHAVDNVKAELKANGFVELYEADAWQIEAGGKYFVCRNGSSVVAFVNRGSSFMITASHSDFPALAVKGAENSGAYTKLSVEKYGGGILYSWLDRPLGIAGRAVVETENGVKSRLVDFKDVSVVIPSVAIHMRRDINDNCKLSPAKDMLPLAGLGSGFREKLAELCATSEEKVIAYDLRLYNKEPAGSVGFEEELMLAPRIDNLVSVRASLSAFLEAKTEGTPVLAVFDNEEVGSSTKQGANSTLLHDTLRRISESEEEYCRRLAGSFMISCDNAHAIHPNYPELADKENAPVMGAGVAVKYNSNQAYTTDAVSDAIFRAVCKKADVKLQKYYNRADMLGGSTLGSISNTKVSVATVDIGIPQLAMHSSTETCAFSDIAELEKALSAFYNSSITQRGENITIG